MKNFQTYLIVSYLKRKFVLDIIRHTGSCKNITERSKVPFTQFLSVLTFYITIEQHQNQETVSGTMCVFRSMPFTFNICSDLHNHNSNQDIGLVHYHKDFRYCYPLYSHSHSFLPPIPNTLQLLICPAFLHFYSSHTESDSAFTQHNASGI